MRSGLLFVLAVLVLGVGGAAFASNSEGQSRGLKTEEPPFLHPELVWKI
jgi:hypothetical protein